MDEFDYIPDFKKSEELTDTIIDMIKQLPKFGELDGHVIVDEFELRTRLENVLSEGIKLKTLF
jgi:hypothetical protein